MSDKKQCDRCKSIVDDSVNVVAFADGGVGSNIKDDDLCKRCYKEYLKWLKGEK